MSKLSIDSAIDLVRESIRETSDDSVYTDKYIYRILLQNRAELLEQLQKQNKTFSPWLYQRFCLKLCPSTFIECGCNPYGFACNVYRSVNPVPQPLSNDALLLNISELFGDNINRVTEREFRTLKNRKYKPKYYYYIGHFKDDQYLFILADTNIVAPKYIKAEGIFEDPTDVFKYACKDTECIQLTDSGFPFKLAKESALIKMTVEIILMSKKLPEDLSNNNKSTPEQLII